MSSSDAQKPDFTRVEEATFQSVQGAPVRPWFPDQNVDVTAWSFSGTVYGEPVGAEDPESQSGEQEDQGPTVESLTVELEQARAQLDNQRNQHERAQASLQGPYDAAVRRIDQTIGTLEQRVAQDVVSMAVMMAETLIAQSAAADESVLVQNLSRALERVGPVEHLRIDANVEDVARLREIAPDMAKERTGRVVDVIVTASERLSRGGVVLSFDRGVIDASWGSQLGHLGEAVTLAMDEERLAATSPQGQETSEPSPDAATSVSVEAETVAAVPEGQDEEETS